MAASESESLSAALHRATDLVTLFSTYTLGDHDLPWLRNFKNIYRPVRKLGQGVWGQVILMTDLRSREKVAVKLATLSPGNVDSLVKETQVMRRISTLDEFGERRGLPRFHTYFVISDSSQKVYTFALVMEYIEGQSLDDVLEKTFGAPLDPQTVVKFAYWLFDTLAFLHRHNIIHHDVKPANIILNSLTGEFYLVDFGFTCFASPAHRYACDTLKVYGSPMYMPPEFFSSPADRPLELASAADVWSAGVTIWEFMTGRPFYEGSSIEGLKIRIHSATQHLYVPPTMTRAYPDFKVLTNQIFRARPQDRLSASDARLILSSFFVLPPVPRESILYS